MPELPDVLLYVNCLRSRVQNTPLQKVRLASPFLLRSVTPPLSAAEGKKVVDVLRIGKRIALSLEDDLFLVVHLMIAGRFRWKKEGTAVPKKLGLAAFDFPAGTLLLTEASKKKRASLHVLRGKENLAPFDRGGLEVMEASLADFQEALTRENRTLKRALTDPRLFSGIGNAYSDEILHRARLSPLNLTRKLTPEKISNLHQATQEVLALWIKRLADEVGDGFPEKVTAFRKEMAVHGKFKTPCPDCGTPVQRIIYAANEANYCPKCQTKGKLLADRVLSRMMKDDWPKSLEELEERKKQP